jgi:hypothetical protein
MPAMATESKRRLEQRVARAAEAALAERDVVATIDVLVGLGWLSPRWVDAWRQGRVDCLEAGVDAGLGKVSSAMRLFRDWAERRGLEPSETADVARSRDRAQLRFSKSGDPAVERAYRTHWVSPTLSDTKRARLAERQSRPSELVVVSPISAWTCTACGGNGDLLIMDAPGPLCMTCADMDHLVFLEAGDAALTRRAKRASRLSAVVVRFSRARRRYERQGTLVEEEALQRAEAECLTDEPAAIELAVAASVRHQDTAYDELLMSGVERIDARETVRDDVVRVLESWRRASPARARQSR